MVAATPTPPDRAIEEGSLVDGCEMILSLPFERDLSRVSCVLAKTSGSSDVTSRFFVSTPRTTIQQCVPSHLLVFRYRQSYMGIPKSLLILLPLIRASDIVVCARMQTRIKSTQTRLLQLAFESFTHGFSFRTAAAMMRNAGD